mmetsp:Transcript_54284/g.176445  ORF Transcript_54284/g.176445 Transcript_54284/m.176445 type:complete len:210 (+) Transcript_54284:3187-3816(+)
MPSFSTCTGALYSTFSATPGSLASMETHIEVSSSPSSAPAERPMHSRTSKQVWPYDTNGRASGHRNVKMGVSTIGSTMTNNSRETISLVSVPRPLPKSLTVVFTTTAPCQSRAGMNCSLPGPRCMLLNISVVAWNCSLRTPVVKHPSSSNLYSHGSSKSTPRSSHMKRVFHSLPVASSKVKSSGWSPASMSLTNKGLKNTGSAGSSFIF